MKAPSSLPSAHDQTRGPQSQESNFQKCRVLGRFYNCKQKHSGQNKHIIPIEERVSTAQDLENIGVGPTCETVNIRWNERNCLATADDISDMKHVLTTNQWVRHQPGDCKHPEAIKGTSDHPTPMPHQLTHQQFKRVGCSDWRLCDTAPSGGEHVERTRSNRSSALRCSHRDSLVTSGRRDLAVGCHSHKNRTTTRSRTTCPNKGDLGRPCYF